MTAHTVTYSPEISGRDVIWQTDCECGWHAESRDANTAYEAAMEHGEFA